MTEVGSTSVSALAKPSRSACSSAERRCAGVNRGRAMPSAFSASEISPGPTTLSASEAKLGPDILRTPAAISMLSRAHVSSTSMVSGAPTPKMTSLDALTAEDVRRQRLVALLGEELPDELHAALMVLVGGLDRVV